MAFPQYEIYQKRKLMFFFFFFVLVLPLHVAAQRWMENGAWSREMEMGLKHPGWFDVCVSEPGCLGHWPTGIFFPLQMLFCYWLLSLLATPVALDYNNNYH